MESIRTEVVTAGTVCVQCKHRYIDEDGPHGPDMWYNNYCMAADPTKGTDWTTGRVTLDRPYCRDINPEGKCVLFDAKP